jgi:tape measure domain-containing protein
MATYSYNVVINLGTNTGGVQRGNEKAKQELRQWERDIIDSHKRIDTERQNDLDRERRYQKELTTVYADEAARRRDISINRFNEQKAQTERERQLDLQHEKDRVRQQTLNDSEIAGNRRDARIEDFKAKKQQYELEERLDREHGNRIIADETKRNSEIAFNRQQDRIANFRAQQEQSRQSWDFEARGQDAHYRRMKDIHLKNFQEFMNLNKTMGAKGGGPGGPGGPGGGGGFFSNFAGGLTSQQFGRAFAGAFVGAAAGMTFAAIVGGIMDVANAMVQAGAAAVRYAGDLEMTTNALAVFTGSARSAKSELAAIDEIARDTVGLRLQGAEQGYQQLRALGFEAQTARGFIKELGEEKILSGASDEAIQKVIFNFAQIASGGQKVSQEIRELVTQMPTLLQVFEKSFGTTNPQMLQEIFDRDTVGAFNQLIATMREGEMAVPGFNDALGKLEDSLISVGRTAAEPLMNELTQDFIKATEWIHANADEFRAWGETVLSVWQALKTGAFNFNEELGRMSEFMKSLGPLNDLANTIVSYTPSGLIGSGVASAFKNGEQYSPAVQEAIARRQVQKAQQQAERDAAGERAAMEREMRQVAERQAEVARKRNIKLEETRGKEEQENLKLDFQKKEALLRSHHRATIEDEIQYTRQSSTLQEDYIMKEYEAKSASLSRLLLLQGQSAEDQEKIMSELRMLDAKSNAQIVINKAETVAKLEALQRRANEEQRQLSIEYNNLALQDTKLRTNAEVEELTRAIEQSVTLSDAKFSRIRQAETEYFNEAIRNNQEQLRLRLQAEGLSEQATINLKRQAQNAEFQMTQEHQDKLRQLDEFYYSEKRKRIEAETQRATQFLQAYLGQLSGASGMLGGGLNVPDFATMEKMVLGQSIDDVRRSRQGQLFTEQKEKEFDRDFLVNTLAPGANAETIDRINTSVAKLNEEIKQLEENSRNWTNILQPTTAAIVRDIERLKQGLGDIDTIDNLRMNTLEQTFTTELSLIDLQIKKQEKLAQVAKEHLQPLDEANAIGEKNILVEQQKALVLEQTQRRAEEYRKTLRGMDEVIEGLVSKDPKVMQWLNNMFAGELRQDIIGMLTEIERLRFQRENSTVGLEAQLNDERRLTAIVRLKEQIATSPYIDSLRVEEEYLEAIVELRERETDALISINRSRLDIAQQSVYSKNQADAKVLDFFAQQKGITDIVGDAKVNILSDAYSRLDNVIGKLTQRMWIFGDALREVMSSVVKLALNRVFMRMFGFDPSASGGGFGGGFGGGGGAGGGGGLFNLPQMIFGGGAGGGGVAGAIPLNGGGLNIQDLVMNAGRGSIMPQSGQLGTSILLRNGGIFSTDSGLLGAGTSPVSRGGGLLGGLKGLGPILPFLGAGLGMGLGGRSIGGNILGALGGALGGVGVGIATGALNAGTFGLGGIAASYGLLAAAGVVGAVAAPLLIGAYLLNRNKKRREEEKVRDKAMVDAFRQLDGMISDVQADRIDGAGALSQAEQIRAQYLESMGQLKDKKTRSHALADVHRIDAKIALLRTAVDDQTRRKERLEKLIPTFAHGGALDYSYNPTGFQTGRGTSRSDSMMGYFPASDTYARFSNTEYILDAETVRNIGVNNLEQMRLSKGASYNDLKKRVNPRSLAIGGAVAVTPRIGDAIAQNASITNKPVNMTMNVNLGIAKENFIEVVTAYLTEEGGAEMLMDVIANINQNDGNNKFAQTLFNMLKDRTK